MKQVREPLGALTARDGGHRRGSRSRSRGCPTADYAIVDFRSSFASKAVGRETVTLEREGGALARRRLRDRLSPARQSDASGDRRALEVRVSRLRRRGELESREAEARVPVLRHRVAGAARRRRRDRRARPRRRAARHRRRPPRLAGASGARSSAGAATRSRCSIPRGRRRTASSAARRSSCPTRRRSRRSGRRACCRSRSASRRRATASARGTAGCGSRPGALKKTALTDTVRGVYLPYWTFDAPRRRRRGPPRPGTTTTRPRPTRENGQTHTRQVQHVRWEPAAGPRPALLRRRPRLRVGRRPPGPAARHRAVSDRRAQALRRRLRRRLGRRALPDRPRRGRAARARRDGREAAGACARSRCPATPTATSRSAPTGRGRRSSTSSRRCGCCPTRTAASAYQCAMNGVTGAIDGEYPKSPWKIALLVLAVLVAVIVARRSGGR